MIMERILIRKEEYEEEIKMIAIEKELKIKRFNTKKNRKSFKNATMEKYII